MEPTPVTTPKCVYCGATEDLVSAAGPGRFQRMCRDIPACRSRSRRNPAIHARTAEDEQAAAWPHTHEYVPVAVKAGTLYGCVGCEHTHVAPAV